VKALNVIESAYRGTLEEQDDTIVWLTHALKGAGAEIDVLLRGNAVNYIVAGQKVTGLSFGTRTQKHAPDIVGDIKGLIGKGVAVYYIAEDASERGLADGDMIPGVNSVGRLALALLYDGYNQVWNW